MSQRCQPPRPVPLRVFAVALLLSVAAVIPVPRARADTLAWDWTAGDCDADGAADDGFLADREVAAGVGTPVCVTPPSYVLAQPGGPSLRVYVGITIEGHAFGETSDASVLPHCRTAAASPVTVHSTTVCTASSPRYGGGILFTPGTAVEETCTSCGDCSAKLGDPSVSVVKLANDISLPSGTCIDDPPGFTGKTLDCQGHRITTGPSYPGLGIYTQSGGNTIRNCSIETSGKWNSAIFLNHSSNNTVVLNTIHTTGQAAYGISTNTAHHNTLSYNVITTSGQNGVGIQHTGSSADTITHNTIHTGGEAAYGMTLGASNVVQANAITTTGPSGYGFDLLDGDATGNGVAFNTVSTSGYAAVGLAVYGNGNAFASNTIRTAGTSGAYAIILTSGATGNTFSNNDVSSTWSDAVHVWQSPGNTFSGNRITRSPSGIVVNGSANTTITGNRIINSAGTGIRLLSNSSGATVASNVVCSVDGTDIADEDANDGAASDDDNTCDSTAGWDDFGTTGCTQPCSTFAWCGDGAVQSPNGLGEDEQCDDGNLLDGDGCDAQCMREIVPIPTPEGDDVVVGDAATGVEIAFARVTSAGTTTVAPVDAGPAPPRLYVPGLAPPYLEIETDAGYEGDVQVCVPYDEANVVGAEEGLRLLHYDAAAAAWRDRTRWVDTGGNRVCGAVTGFSVFAVMSVDAADFTCWSAKDEKKVCQHDPEQSCKIDSRGVDSCDGGGVGPCMTGFPKGVAREVADALEDKVFALQKPVAVCIPADAEKRHPGAESDPGHLESFQGKDGKACSDDGRPCEADADCAPGASCETPPKHTKTRVVAENEHGSLILETVKPDRLLAPTGTSPVAPHPAIPTHVGHYKCYAVKVVKNACFADPTVACAGDEDCPGGRCSSPFEKGQLRRVKDLVTERLYELGKPTRLCAPADKAGEDPAAPAELLRYLCHAAKPVSARCDEAAPLNPVTPCSREEDCGGVKGVTAWCIEQDELAPLEHVHLANQFGEGLVGLKDRVEICIPTVGSSGP